MMFSCRTAASRVAGRTFYQQKPLSSWHDRIPIGRRNGSVSFSSTVEPVRSEYVHPLSQIVLEHLQNNRSDWVVRMGLERGLTFHRDGTFVLKFPTFDDDHSKIWTSYDPEEKKHWLTVHKANLVGRFLLQDNLKPAWHSDRRSLPERIHDAVDEMIQKIDEGKEEKSQEAK